MTSERVSLAFQQIFPTSVTKTRKFVATQAPATSSRRSVARYDIWLALLVSSTRAIIDDRMTVISALGKSWLIANIPLHSSIIYHRDALKTGQAVNRDLHFAVASVSFRYVTLSLGVNWVLSPIVLYHEACFCEWCLCVCIFSLFFICLPDSLFVPDFNGQKVSDLIAVALLIQIYMIVRLLDEVRPVSVHHCRFSSLNVTDLFYHSFAPVYTEQRVHKGSFWQDFDTKCQVYSIYYQEWSLECAPTARRLPYKTLKIGLTLNKSLNYENVFRPTPKHI